MGHKQSIKSHVTMNELAFGMRPNAAQTDEVIEVTQRIPEKLFGSKRIEDDPSIQQMQHELLSFDDTLRRLFRRKRKNQSKKQDSSYESYEDRQYDAENQEYYDPYRQYYAENQEYYDPYRQFYAENQEYLDRNQEYYAENQEYLHGNQEYFDRNLELIHEEDEDNLSSSSANDKKQILNRDTENGLSWRCKYCTEKNKSSDVDCRHCKQSRTNF
ncbi:unnamed protein product [Rotaria sordida]|uniref:RanBP2-type domain-containing protein n=1 Tax=Rotaria sordida TaxID=392033 RepID=A0A819RN04_9BILA|nr:unnamed protein product [Rotaria sordida]CAF4050493.1 unnamed protein product [Rotaria sordida]